MAEGGARDAIFARIRRSLAASGEDARRRRAVDDRLARHARNLIPQRARLDHAGQVELFRAQAQAVQATVEEVASPADIPERVSDYLRRHNLPQRLRRGSDELIATMPWKQRAPQIELVSGPADDSDEASLSHAIAGVAETGTLILASGPENPTTLNFLPDNHIVVLQKSDVIGVYEDVWDRLRADYGKGALPRTLNMITGPSRTGDIEQTIELGAHGPRRLHIILVGE